MFVVTAFSKYRSGMSSPAVPMLLQIRWWAVLVNTSSSVISGSISSNASLRPVSQAPLPVYCNVKASQASGTLALNDNGQSNLKVHADTPSLETIGKLVKQPLVGIAKVDATITGNRRELQATGNMAESQTSLVQLLDRRRQEVSGVSLDEEAMNLLRQQKAYEAAARMMTAVDQMLEKLINDTGVVGR